jgi:peptide/nickel transport system substrate-binding protein
MKRLFLALAALTAIAFSPTADAQRRSDPRVLRVVPNANLITLDPINTTAGVVQSHGMMVYDFLFGRDADQVVRPQMVENWVASPDGLTWRFVLRDGLEFHDGAPVTAADVVASLRRWGARDPYGRQIMAVTSRIEAPDDKTIVWVLTRPYGLMLEALSKSGGNIPAIMPRRIAETDPFRNITDATGSGPFIFVREEWVPGSRVVYRRNERYRPRAEPASGTAGGKRALVDRVEWLIMPDAQTAVNALVAGEVDFVETPSVDHLPVLRQRGQRTIITNALGFQGMLRMNHLHPPFNDARARRALVYLVNQEEYLLAMFGPDRNLWRVCHAFFVCGSPLESDAGVEPGYGRDRARARQLMQESGYDGRPIVILQPADVPFLNAATLVLADELRAIGVTVDLQVTDFATMASRRAIRRPPNEGGWHIGLTWWNGLGASDPVGNVPMQASCDQAWPGWPCDAPHQALIDSYPFARSADERRQVAARLQDSAYRVVPYVPIGQWFLPVAHAPGLRGVLGAPQVMVLWNIEKQ